MFSIGLIWRPQWGQADLVHRLSPDGIRAIRTLANDPKTRPRMAEKKNQNGAKDEFSTVPAFNYLETSYLTTSNRVLRKW